MSWHRFVFMISIMICFFMGHRASGFELAENPQDIEFSLLTVGRGEAVYALYGHTILRVKNDKTGLDVGLNWGVFDFHSPLFVWNFYKGVLRYQLAVTPTAELLQHYRILEKRTVIEDKLRLTLKQKQTLLDRLQWNLKPENIAYDYDQFKDNCATRPRDHLDAALNGKLKQRFIEVNSYLTYRDFIREGARLLPWAYLGLDQFTNERLDRGITSWEAMFIPNALRSLLLEMPAIDDLGDVQPRETLLYGAQKLVDLPEPTQDSDPYVYLAMILLFPGSFLSLLSLRYSNRIGRVSRSILVICAGCYSGLLGLISLINYTLSGYPQLKSVANFLIFNPLDLLLMLMAWRRLSFITGWPLKIYAVCRIVTICGAIYGWSFGVIKQNISGALASGGVFMMMAFLAILLEKGDGSKPAQS